MPKLTYPGCSAFHAGRIKEPLHGTYKDSYPILNSGVLLRLCQAAGHPVPVPQDLGRNVTFITIQVGR